MNFVISYMTLYHASSAFTSRCVVLYRLRVVCENARISLSPLWLNSPLVVPCDQKNLLCEAGQLKKRLIEAFLLSSG